MISNDILTIGTTLAAAIVAVAAVLPKLITSFKRDKLDGAVADAQSSMVDGMSGTYEKQLKFLDDRVQKLDQRVAAMEDIIHLQAVKITRLMVVVTHLRTLLNLNKIPLSEFVQTEIEDLTNSAMNEPIAK